MDSPTIDKVRSVLDYADTAFTRENERAKDAQKRGDEYSRAQHSAKAVAYAITAELLRDALEGVEK